MTKIVSPQISMQTIDGRTVRVARWTNEKSDQFPLLFFNGIGANLELIAPLAEKMPERDFVTFDMPGVGGSPDPAVPYRPWMMARIADLLLDQFGYDKVDVLGISWGGGLAQQYAIQFGSRVNRLILVATTAGMLMMPGKISALSKMIDPRRYIDPDYMLKNFKTLYGNGALYLNEKTGKEDWKGGVKLTIKDGIVYDAKQLLADVAAMVEKQKKAAAAKK